MGQVAYCAGAGLLALVLVAAPPLYAQQPPPAGFGPGYDPTRPPPEEPQTTGAGFTSATLVVSGEAVVEELRDAAHPNGPSYFGVVLDVAVAASSVTPALGVASVLLHSETEEAPTTLVAICSPTPDPGLELYRSPGTKLSAWNIAVKERVFACAGGLRRMVSLVDSGNVRLSTLAGPPSAAGWKGTLVLLFESPVALPSSVDLAGRVVKLPRSGNEGAAPTQAAAPTEGTRSN